MPVDHADHILSRSHIHIKGARIHNLKGLSVAIPHNQLVVITGLSGSGKSSLAFDTLFAEGQRRYVESLSTYARQFLGRMEKPPVDFIKGLTPAIAIEQKGQNRHPRSTVGTMTEIYEYLKLLYARIGATYSPISHEQVTKDSVSDIVDYIHTYPQGTRVMILYPLGNTPKTELADVLKIVLAKGFTRVVRQGEVKFIEEMLQDSATTARDKAPLDVIVDRCVVDKPDSDEAYRIADSIRTAFFEGHGTCLVDVVEQGRRTFSDRFEHDGMTFEEPSVAFFSFGNPYGACKTCEGLGQIMGVDPDKVIPDKTLSVSEGAILPWKGAKMQSWLTPLLANGRSWGFPLNKPYKDLHDKYKEVLWQGCKTFKGLNTFFNYLEANVHQIQYKILLSRYVGKTRCKDCQGTRIRKDAAYVKVGDHSITELLIKPIDDLAAYFDQLTLTEHQRLIAERLLLEIKSRLSYMQQVGLGYLTLNRLTATLSGGEHQRIKVATALSSTLVGTTYILDEPTIGLHPRDTKRLTDVLFRLKQLGNTVIVVEHEEAVMKVADQLIEIGPEAGTGGGNLVFQGTLEALRQSDQGYTARYLNNIDRIELPTERRKSAYAFRILGARENNLKDINVEIPLGVMVTITGVSGSGKSTLVNRIIYPALRYWLGLRGDAIGECDKLDGDLDHISHIEFIDQQPIGKSSRSNPATYVKAYDMIRSLFAGQPLAQERRYSAGDFSFNTPGGRCETCQGEGETKIEMQFMADIYLPCEACQGRRFQDEILEVAYAGKNIADVLAMTVDEAMEFFARERVILSLLSPLQEVGLGYMQLGQSANSLSGGEAQRVKLASYLSKDRPDAHTLFVFDEPTTGLHMHDISKLLHSINALIQAGNSVLIIEHNMEVIKCADWVIDLGPEGGERGGEVVFSGTPEELVQVGKSYTGRYLRGKLRGQIT
ncbi:MAG: excinuclease ABC subunit UvrA [Bacteroidota bacterium]